MSTIGSRMLHFSRRTLWIIIYITIALIFVLHRSGERASTPQPEPPGPSERAGGRQVWSLDAIQFNRSDGLWVVNLPSAAQVRITVAQPLMPTDSLPIDPTDALSTSHQGGRFLVTLSNPAQLAAITTSVDFLVGWLPDGQPRSVIVSGPLSAELLEPIKRLRGTLSGTGVATEVSPRAAVSRLTSPPMGSDRQLAFLLWIGVLQQRLGGYQPEVRWDHRRPVSEVLFNQSLSSDLFEPVTQAELAPVLEAYQASAAVRQRSAEQIHRYLTTTAVYQLPLNFMLRQPNRLAGVGLADVNQQRQRSLSEL